MQQLSTAELIILWIEKNEIFNNTTRKNTTQKYNTHVQREVELSSPEFSIMEKGPNQQYVDIRPITFHNDDHMNVQIEKTDKHLASLQPKSLLHSIVYLISEAKSSTPFHLLIRLKRNR